MVRAPPNNVDASVGGIGCKTLVAFAGSRFAAIILLGRHQVYARTNQKVIVDGQVKRDTQRLNEDSKVKWIVKHMMNMDQRYTERLTQRDQELHIRSGYKKVEPVGWGGRSDA